MSLSKRHAENQGHRRGALAFAGGKFRYNYWGRGIKISRSNTVVDGITHRVSGETEVGHPYNGFLSVQQAANITFRNCRVDARKAYSTLGAAGEPVSMGTYGYRADLVLLDSDGHVQHSWADGLALV